LQVVGLDVGNHDKFHPRQGLVIVQLVLFGAITEETRPKSILMAISLDVISYLLSSPPNLREIFRREKTTPKISLASSSLDKAFRGTSLLVIPTSPDFGRSPLGGVGSGFHRFEYMHSALYGSQH